MLPKLEKRCLPPVPKFTEGKARRMQGNHSCSCASAVYPRPRCMYSRKAVESDASTTASCDEQASETASQASATTEELGSVPRTSEKDCSKCTYKCTCVVI